MNDTIFFSHFYLIDKSYDDFVNKLGKIENNEDKLIQLHELVVNQRKTIDNLSTVNQDLTRKV